MMMRPKAVTVYLPFVEEVVDDFIAQIKKIHNSDGTIENFRLEAAKWNLECKIPKPISWVIQFKILFTFSSGNSLSITFICLQEILVHLSSLSFIRKLRCSYDGPIHLMSTHTV